MALSLAFVLLLLFLMVTVIVAILALAGVITRKDRPVREERAVILARLGGAFLGLIAAAMFAGLPSFLGFDLGLGRGAMLAPVVFGLILLGGVIVGELMTRAPAPAGSRTADLSPRRVIDYVPPAYGFALVLIGVGLLLLLAGTTLSASSDDLGRAGRVLTNVCGGGLTASRGPYPGSYYSLPLIIGVLSAVALAAYAARSAVQRPRGDLPRLGADYLRRRSIAAVTGGLGMAISGPALGVALVSAVTLLGSDCAPGWQRSMGALAALLALGSVIVIFWSIQVITFSGMLAGRTAANPAPERSEQP